jgi:hypothetical protein
VDGAGSRQRVDGLAQWAKGKLLECSERMVDLSVVNFTEIIK